MGKYPDVHEHKNAWRPYSFHLMFIIQPYTPFTLYSSNMHILAFIHSSSLTLTRVVSMKTHRHNASWHCIRTHHLNMKHHHIKSFHYHTSLVIPQFCTIFMDSMWEFHSSSFTRIAEMVRIFIWAFESLNFGKNRGRMKSTYFRILGLDFLSILHNIYEESNSLFQWEDNVLACLKKR